MRWMMPRHLASGKARLRDHRPRSRAGNRRARHRCGCGRGATNHRRNRRFEHGTDRFREVRRALRWLSGRARQRPGRPVGRQTGPPQRLADIDIAEPGHQPLIHERGLQRRLASGEEAGKRGAGELVAERLDADRAEMRRGGNVGAGNQIHQAEAARIVEDHAHAGRQVEDDVVMGGEFRARTVAVGDRPAVAVRIRRGTSRTCRDA